MIISERHLFKGLVDESPTPKEDPLFDLGHAFAVSTAIVFVALMLIGAFVTAL